MLELPTGTVTLLFSDMEGSTRLLDRLGDRYVDVLSAQRRVLRSAWAEHSGVEMGTEGDSFFVVFASASDAVAAAVAGQRALGALEFDEADRPRVRMGIHTGSPARHDDGYVGMDVHRGARVAGVAHGGQVVVSSTTAALVRDHDGVELVDLGSHRLKDIAQLETLFQVAADGLAREFPPLRSLGTTTGLPKTLTVLVGRDGELAELADLIASGVRLVTLTGPGGSGKTRLATAVAELTADRFSGGVFFVALVTATTQQAMWTGIADALGLPAEGKVPPAFFEHVVHRSALLVLDNLEQVDGADQVVSELLTNAPDIVIVATSRGPLHLRGEHEHAVPPLELPATDDIHETAGSGAVQLFVQHAQMVRPSFVLTADNAGAVGEICRRLDGLPLAVELAAARVKLLSPQALVKRLDHTLDLGSAGADRPTRQQTLRDTIAWSYELLSAEHRRFLDTLGVFVGGADLEAVESVVAGDPDAAGVDVFDAVTALVDASLLTLRETEDGEPWVGLLETIREFALEQLAETGRLEQIQRLHAQHYLARALLDQRLLRDRTTGATSSSLEAVTTSAWKHAHAANIRAALAWSLAAHDPADLERTEAAQRLVVFAAPLFADAHLLEGLDRAQEALAAAAGQRTEAVLKCLIAATDFARQLGRWEDSLDYASRAVAISGDLDVFAQGRAHGALALHFATTGKLREARTEAERSVNLAREARDRTGALQGLHFLGIIEQTEGNFERALVANREALRLAVELNDTAFVTTQRQNIACCLQDLGHSDEAFDELASIEADIVAEEDTDTLCCYAEDLALVCGGLGRQLAVAQLVGAAEGLRSRTGNARTQDQEVTVRDLVDRARSALGDRWQAEYDGGARHAVADVVAAAIASIQAARASVGEGDRR